MLLIILVSNTYVLYTYTNIFLTVLSCHFLRYGRTNFKTSTLTSLIRFMHIKNNKLRNSSSC